MVLSAAGVLADTWWHTFSEEGCGWGTCFATVPFCCLPLSPCRLSALYSGFCSLPAGYGEMLLTNKWSTSPQICPKKEIWQLQHSADVSGQLCGLSSAEFHCVLLVLEIPRSFSCGLLRNAYLLLYGCFHYLCALNQAMISFCILRICILVMLRPREEPYFI